MLLQGGVYVASSPLPREEIITGSIVYRLEGTDSDAVNIGVPTQGGTVRAKHHRFMHGARQQLNIQTDREAGYGISAS